MLDGEFIAKFCALVLLVVLAGFLFHTRIEQMRVRRSRQRPPFQPTGQTIDVTPIRPRLAALKRDFTAAAPHRHAPSGSARADLLAQARQRLTRLGFFRDIPRGTEPESLPH
jgi:hypothetical protein